MKQIQELIKATQVLRVEGNSDTRVSRLAYDSRRIAPGDCFFAVSGTQSDGHAYIDAAVTAGAAAVVCQRLPEHLAPSVCYVFVADTNRRDTEITDSFCRVFQRHGIQRIRTIILYIVNIPGEAYVGIIQQVFHILTGFCAVPEMFQNTVGIGFHLIQRIFGLEGKRCPIYSN